MFVSCAPSLFSPSFFCTGGGPQSKAGLSTVLDAWRLEQDGVIDPAKPFLGPVKDGGHIIANTAPGCWGPMVSARLVAAQRRTTHMLPSARALLHAPNHTHARARTEPHTCSQITPHIKGGHEVTIPTEVAGAEVGDSVAIRIKSIAITSLATASGNDFWVDGKYKGDPYCAKYHTEEKKFYPETYVDGIGEDAVKYKTTKESATPFKFANGYTIAFDKQHKVGVTMNKQGAETIAQRAKHSPCEPASERYGCPATTTRWLQFHLSVWRAGATSE